MATLFQYARKSAQLCKPFAFYPIVKLIACCLFSFSAPEIVNYEALGLEADMWSVGVITYILQVNLNDIMSLRGLCR